VIVLGDLNDIPEAATTPDPARPTRLRDRHRRLRQPDRGDGQRLWNLASRIPAADRYSRICRGRPELS
jgi:hypothetical protein